MDKYDILKALNYTEDWWELFKKDNGLIGDISTFYDECMVVDEMVFTPIYTDGKLVKTGEEVYNEWLTIKEPKPNQDEIWKNQVEQAIGTLAEQVAKNTLIGGSL